MSLKLRRITANNFRKFRVPVTIDGLTDGLNIVVEPNETGKSTLLEAIRAAFFVPHRSSNQLTRSYQPFGENVAPEVEVSFDVAGVPWTVTKRFLKSPSMEVRGPSGRGQGDSAEEQLQALLGFEKDTSRNGDVTAYGALGLLWVGQAEALAVSAPGRIVRDTIQATLEAEVGTILGGAAYERVRERVDQQCAVFWTAKGSPGGEQKAARERLDQAQVIAREAASKVELLEKSFGEVEAARVRLKLLQREMADTTDTDRRADLVRSLEIARAAAQMLAQRKAERNATVHDARSIERGIANIDARQAAASEVRRQLETDIARLEGTIESEGGKGLAERAAVATEEATAAEQALSRTSEEAQTLKLLQDTLEEVRTETSRTYVGPVTTRAKRHIERLLPGSELLFADDLGLAAISRGGSPEDCVSLSRGTQEQLAVLTRLAIADLLREEGRPVSLILDDPLVYADDTRLDLMTEILTEAAQHMQVILLTCRERAFRHMTGTRLVL